MIAVQKALLAECNSQKLQYHTCVQQFKEHSPRETCGVEYCISKYSYKQPVGAYHRKPYQKVKRKPMPSERNREGYTCRQMGPPLIRT